MFVFNYIGRQRNRKICTYGHDVFSAPSLYVTCKCTVNESLVGRGQLVFERAI